MWRCRRKLHCFHHPTAFCSGLPVWWRTLDRPWEGGWARTRGEVKENLVREMCRARKRKKDKRKK